MDDESFSRSALLFLLPFDLESSISLTSKHNLWSCEKWLDALLPRKCAACNESSRFKAICSICADTIVSSKDRSENKESIASFFLYQGTIKQIVKEAKFGRNESKANALIQFWSKNTSKNEILDQLNNSPFDAISFIPIHWRRRIWRGFDLSAIFAKELSKKLKLPIMDLLISKKFNSPLTLAQNKQEREQILKNRFELRKKTFAKHKILLVDDIVTTGTTLKTAGQLLVNDGHQITPLAFAKTVKKT